MLKKYPLNGSIIMSFGKFEDLKI